MDYEGKSAYINSIGTAVPRFKISQSHHHSILESANGLNRLERLKLKTIYHKSGIDFRFSVLEEFNNEDLPQNEVFHPAGNTSPVPVSKRMEIFDRHASLLAAEAVRACLSNLPSFKLSDITHLITFSCTGMSAPGVDIQLVEILGLRKNVARTCINFMGCYAAISALRLAQSICNADVAATVLLAGVELCTLHYQRSMEDDQILANALFADGAAAAIVSSKSFIKSKSFKLENFYSEFESAGKSEMVWKIGDHGFDLRLSSYVPGMIKDHISPLIDRMFTSAHLTKDDVSYYAIHPGGIKILEACESALQITKEQNAIAYNVLRNFGNMSSVTILFVLNQWMNTFTEEDSGKKMLSCAFGPGLTMEAMLLEIC
jgi:alpha-pyrone synthase